MAKLADVSLAGGVFPTGVAASVGGSGSATVTAGGLTGGSSYKINVQHPTGATHNAAAQITLGTLSGTTAGLIRGVGGYLRCNTFTGSGSQQVRLIRVQSNSGSTFAGQIVKQNFAYWDVVQPADAGNQTTKLPLNFFPLTLNRIYEFYYCVELSASADSANYYIYIDRQLVRSWRYDWNTGPPYGTGVSLFELGNRTGDTAVTINVDYGGLYVADEIRDFGLSAEGGLSGYSAPVASTSRTVALSSPHGSPSWALDDTSVASISSGTVTLLQSSGAVVVARDGQGSCVEVEFDPRSATWSAGAYTLDGTTLTVPITLDSVSDGYTSYADLVPSIVGTSNCYLTALTGTAGSGTFEATLETTDSGAGGPYVVRLAGEEVTLSPPSSGDERGPGRWHPGMVTRRVA